MKKQVSIFVFCVLLATEGVAFGSSSSRIIREDRVWEYVYEAYHGSFYNTLFRLRFDGTEEFNGLTYHRLVHSGDMVCWKMEEEGVLVSCENLPNDNDMVYYMREEDGKVYLLNRDLGDCIVDDLNPPPVEFLVYDFDRKAGESYELWAGIWYWNGLPEWHSTGEGAECKILSTEKVEIDGEECFVQNVSYRMPSTDYFKIIDGIGFVEHGFLPFLYCDMRTGFDTVECNLNRVYNAEGDIIYRALDIDSETVYVEKVNDKSSLSLNYGGEAVFAESSDGTAISLSLLDISGTVMSRVSGTGSVSASTFALSPGVYVAVAEADGSTVARRKFVVK